MDWRVHIEHLIPTLSMVCHYNSKKNVTSYVNNDILCLFSLINFIWYNILGQFSIQYSNIQIAENIIRTIMNSKNRDSCRNLFKNLNLFTFISQHIFSLLPNVITNRKQYSTNSNIHDRNSRYGSDINQTISNLSFSNRFLSYGTHGFLNS